MSRFFRTFPGKSVFPTRQALEATQTPTVTRLILPTVVGVAAMAASVHGAEARHQPHIIAPRPAALTNHAQLAAGIPRTTHVVLAVQSPPRQRHPGDVVAPRPAALTNHAILAAGLPRTIVVVDTASPPRQRHRGIVIAPRPEGLIFTTVAAATPLRTVTTILAAQPLRQRHRGSVIAPRPEGLIFTPTAAVTPPRTVFVVTALAGPHVLLGHIIAPRPVFAAVSPPRPVVIDQASFKRRVMRSGVVVVARRPVFAPVTAPRPLVVDQAAFQRRRQGQSRIIVTQPPRGVTVAPTSPIVLAELLGYVTDGADSGIPNQLLGTGFVTLDSTGLPRILGDTGYPTQIYAPNDVCVLGYSNQNLGTTDIPTIEAEIGRSFHGLRQNQQYTNTSVSTAITEYDAGRTLSYRSIQFNTAPGGWAAAASGTFDTQLVALCNAITAAGRWTSQNPFWLCLHHEATTSGGVFGTPGYSAADHKAMWQHCVPVMLATGAPIAFAYVGWDRMFVGLNGVGPPDPGEGFDDLDPGVSFYSRIGSDPYNAVDSPGVLRYGTNAATLLEPIRVAAVARGMDWMIGEMGCQDGSTTQDHVNKAAWTDSLRVYLDGLGTVSPGVCRVMLTTHESANLYQADTSPESLAAWQRLGFDSYYS